MFACLCVCSIFGGVHFRKANTDGQALARETARYVLRALGFK